MVMEYGRPFQGEKLEQLRHFLEAEGLRYEPSIEFTVVAREHGEIIAAGSLDHSVLKCIAVTHARHGDGLAATILTELRKEAFARGLSQLFLYTSPSYRALFQSLFFYPIAETAQALLMENSRTGIHSFLASLEHRESGGTVGAIVANCNPFTLGHLHLVETAARQCSLLHVFILSEERSKFSAQDRMQLVREGTAHLKNVILHPTGGYLVSSATFPSYFLQGQAEAAQAQCQMDLEIFTRYFVPEFQITKRFVGTEPYSPITNAYHEQLKSFLPQFGVSLLEIPRLEIGGNAVSASMVRQLLKQNDFSSIQKIVPDSTYQFLVRERTREE